MPTLGLCESQAVFGKVTLTNPRHGDLNTFLLLTLSRLRLRLTEYREENNRMYGSKSSSAT